MTNQTHDSSADIFGVPADRCLCASACVYLYVCLSHCQSLSSIEPHLFLQYAVEDEDKHALQRVEDGEKVGHDHGALVDVH